MSSETIFRTSLLEENDGPGQNPTDNRTMGEIIASRFSRRGFLKGSLAVSAIAATVSPMALMLADEARAASGSAFTFDEVEAGVDETHHVAAGYDADVLLRWGDPIFADAPAFDPALYTQTPSTFPLVCFGLFRNVAEAAPLEEGPVPASAVCRRSPVPCPTRQPVTSRPRWRSCSGSCRTRGTPGT